MNALGFALTLLFALLAFCLPRRGAALAVVMAVCYITQGQAFILGGFHFTAIRLVLLAALARGFAKGEIRALKSNPIDKAVLIYAVVSAVIYIAREATLDAAVNRVGITYNILLSYFTFRCLLPDYAEVKKFLAGLAVVIVPMALILVVESQNGTDVFYVFGGIAARDEFRDGHYRCSAAFRSSITSGTFGATLLPLFVGLFWVKEHRLNAIVGIAAATLITMTSRSSGPLLAYGAGILGLLCWKFHAHMRQIRRGFVIMIVALHLYMKAPVWFLMGRISDIVGGGGWHRAEIVDAAVNHFGLWWMAGTNETGDWVATQLMEGGADLTNQFVAEGVNAGLLGMALFILILVRAFRGLGLSMGKVLDDSPETPKLLWAIGATLFATIVNFFSVSYFDQIHVIWWLLVAMIAGVTSDLLQRPDNPLEGEAEVERPEELAGQSTFGSAFAPGSVSQ